MISIDRTVRSSLARWQKRIAAEARTAFVIEHRRGYKHPRLMRLGQLHVMDWGDGPRVDSGAGVLSVLDGLRVPTREDAIRIETATAAVVAAQGAAERVYAQAFRRGRRPTLEEIQQAEAQVQAEAAE